MRQPVPHQDPDVAALRFGVAGAVEIDPGQREERQAAHGHIEEGAGADLVDPFVGQCQHQLEKAFPQQDQHQQAEALRDMPESRDESGEPQRPYSRQHVLQLDQRNAGAEHPVGQGFGQKRGQREQPGQHKEIPSLLVCQRIGGIANTARPPVQIGGDRSVQCVAQRKIGPPLAGHVRNGGGDEHHGDDLQRHGGAMGHIRGDVEGVVDGAVRPGIEDRQEQPGKYPEALPIHVVGEVVPQNEDRHHMDQIEEQLDPMHMIVGVIGIHVMAWPPPERFIRCHGRLLVGVAFSWGRIIGWAALWI